MAEKLNPQKSQHIVRLFKQDPNSDHTHQHGWERIYKVQPFNEELQAISGC